MAWSDAGILPKLLISITTTILQTMTEYSIILFSMPLYIQPFEGERKKKKNDESKWKETNGNFEP